MTLAVPLAPAVRLEAGGGVKSVSIYHGHFEHDPSVEQSAAAGYFSRSRTASAAGTASSSTADALTRFARRVRQEAPAFRLELDGEQGNDVKSTPYSGWLRYAATAGAFYDIGDHGRVLELFVSTLLERSTGPNKSPSPNWSRSRGQWPHARILAGQLIGRGRTVSDVPLPLALVAIWLDGSINAAVGNVFGEHLQDFDAGRLRFSGTLGVLGAATHPTGRSRRSSVSGPRRSTTAGRSTRSEYWSVRTEGFEMRWTLLPDLARRAGATFGLLVLGACATGERRFALRAPMVLDTDLRSVAVRCRPDPTPKDPKHVTCAPEPYVSPVIWDGADNLLFRPLSEALAFEATAESVNVNSLDEVPDSAWFTNRIGVHPMSAEDIQRGACDRERSSSTQGADPDGSWVIDKGKENGSSPGFRVVVRGKGKFMFKSDGTVPEHASAASVVGAAAYNAVGFNTSCEQIVYIRRSLLKLNPGLRVAGNFAGGKPFDQKALDAILAVTARRGSLLRFQASAWLPGRLLGPFRYEGTRQDDPNDVIPHENRRELRGGALLAAWLDHFDAREQNSMDSWLADASKEPDSSPGHIVHYYLDTSDCIGSAWDWDEITRRLGFSYIVDWGDLSADFVTLGIPLHPWDRVKRVPSFEQFVYFDVNHFRGREVEKRVPQSRVQPHDRARRRVDGAHPLALRPRGRQGAGGDCKLHRPAPDRLPRARARGDGSRRSWSAT